MPEVSRFFGIVITMYHDEHPPPHFHARYGGRKIIVDIADGRVGGKLPPRAIGLVLEWWSLHQPELARNWQLVNEGKEPEKIQPLE
ncbi:MAG TPA: DUF4160 domain-containing protein [Thermoanaerobaculia bacterium]|nr:DUF4160 domain-containing protein [Thermoanaerobaculia bacterium]